MTRIIGGTAGGRRIATPKGDRTRPTSDRVREALFSAIEAWAGSLRGLRFLDLFAGSGAVGLEAWSRGAEHITFVESDRRTAALIADNARVIGLARPEVIATSVAGALAHGSSSPYDVVFADPPYPLPDAQVAAELSALIEQRWLSPGALVVVERATRSPAPAWPDGLVATRSKKYGETTLHYAEAGPEAATSAG